MKKFLILIFAIIFITNSCFAFSWFKKEKEKNQPTEENVYEGYQGALPDIEKEFDSERKTIEVPKMNDFDTNIEKDKLTPIPRDNKMYIDIIIKQDRTSQYVNDINDIIKIIEKIKNSIETSANVQIFNAQVGSLINHVNFMQEEYHEKSESAYDSYLELINYSNHAREVAVLNAQSQVYKKYLPYESEGEAYSPANVRLQMDYLLDSTNEILDLLKSVN